MFTAVLVLVVAYLLACYAYGGALLIASTRRRRSQKFLPQAGVVGRIDAADVDQRRAA